MPWWTQRSEPLPPMPTLADYVDPPIYLVIECRHCPRRGRMRTDRLLARYGPVHLPHLLHLVAADCPKMIAGRYYDWCGVIYAPESRGL